ncbi:MAG: NUDIX domain-containing protein [Clostridia bacterium]|nr:NUDIX domain-containing protein [Clostridia bacterium]
MTYEKSCGAILFRERDSKREYLLVFNKKGNAKGHWGFPKGHVENDETEENTAKREILEETGINVPEFINGFREVVSYSPTFGIEKDVVYFLAKVEVGTVTIQQSELTDYKWLTYSDAMKLITFNKSLLTKAEDYLKNN